MPDLGGTDPADLEAHARAHLGLSRQLQVDRRVGSHPSKGGAPGYPPWYRVESLDRDDRNEEVVPCPKSLRRWRERLIPFRMTGNRQRSQIVGVDLLNLTIFILAWPEATIDEMATYVYNEGGELFSRAAISKRLGELQITKKTAAKDAYQSQSEEVQFRLNCFFNCPPPLGIRDVPRFRLIDFDEFGVTLEKLNRKGGWALKIFRVRKDGHYHHGAKITCLFAIEPGDPRVPANTRGSIQNPRRWIKCIRQIGTTAMVFADFCDVVCSDIEANPIPGTDDERI